MASGTIKNPVSLIREVMKNELPQMMADINGSDREINTLNAEMAKKKYQVFISSTYKDLIPERAAVMQVLLDNDCIPVGMEQFPASGMSQMEYIRKMLDDCDYYILILAGKYGSLDSDGVSFTEKEYDYAVTKGLPVLGFVYKDLGELSLDNSEITEERRSLLKSFRDKVCANRLVKFYQNVGDLRAEVATSINLCKRDFPAIGWVRGNSALCAMDVSAKWNMVEITSTSHVYANEHYYGSFTFDYSNNNGEFSIGEGEHSFTTKWSKASAKSIHAYNDASNIDSIARIKAPCELTKELSGEYDFSSRCRTPNIGDIIIWKNQNGKYAATKIMSISDDTRGADHDELTCEYLIYE